MSTGGSAFDWRDDDSAQHLRVVLPTPGRRVLLGLSTLATSAAVGSALPEPSVLPVTLLALALAAGLAALWSP
ncbi:MAG: hypothetical protein M3406_06085 [Chloroflexota bacterium]|nr:hypothetical protein [Chloroflexota bacterium]